LASASTATLPSGSVAAIA
jgi:hypothetical protein